MRELTSRVQIEGNKSGKFLRTHLTSGVEICIIYVGGGTMRDYKLQVMLSKDELAILDDLANENGETRSGYMRRLLAEKIRREARKRRYTQLAGGRAGGGGTTTPPFGDQ